MENFIEIESIDGIYLINVSEISNAYFMDTLGEKKKILCLQLKNGTTITTEDVNKYTQLKSLVYCL